MPGSAGPKLAPSSPRPGDRMSSLTEADTCRKYVLPKLYSAGWDDDQISEQKTFTDGRILVGGATPPATPKRSGDTPG